MTLWLQLEAQSQRLAIVCQKPSSKHDDHTTIIEVDESLFWLYVYALGTRPYFNRPGFEASRVAARHSYANDIVMLS